MNVVAVRLFFIYKWGIVLLFVIFMHFLKSHAILFQIEWYSKEASKFKNGLFLEKVTFSVLVTHQITFKGVNTFDYRTDGKFL